MNVTHEQVGPAPPHNAIPVAMYRPYTLTISLSAEEQKSLFKAVACTESTKCKDFTRRRGEENGETLYSFLAGVFYTLRDNGETL